MLEADGDAWPVIYNFYGAMQKRSKTKIEMERIESIKKLKPKKIFLGLDSFRGYVAFVFPKKTVLECPKYGNAIYVFPTKHWKDLSKLSKTKLLKKHSKQIHRIRHADGVEYLLKVLLEKNP